jgi:hypothetical protein
MTQSASLMAGKMDCKVGPGVGKGLSTVQPGEVASSETIASAGVGDFSNSGVSEGLGKDVAKGASVGSASVGALAWQAVRTNINKNKRTLNFLKVVPPILPRVFLNIYIAYQLMPIIP